MLKLLPFSALRTLETVVRLNGFGRAAEELSVTQSAVSQHIKSLEEWTGHQLLIRGARKTVPTDNGLRLASAVAEGFGSVQLVCDELRDRTKPKKRGLLLASPPGFAFVWLLPRLMTFDELNPDIPVSLSTDVFARDAAADVADVMIHYGAGGFPGLHAERLMDEQMTPVCAPEVARKLTSVADLAFHTILHDDVQQLGTPSTWTVWADQVGVALPKSDRIRKYGQANMVVQAAIKGVGVAMGRAPLVTDALVDGSLVCPLPMLAKSQLSYWFVCRPEALKQRRIKMFRDWLFDEVAAQPPMTNLLG